MTCEEVQKAENLDKQELSSGSVGAGTTAAANKMSGIGTTATANKIAGDGTTVATNKIAGAGTTAASNKMAGIGTTAGGNFGGCSTEELVESHTGLVKSVAFKLASVYGEDVDDLIQIGYIGLLKAIKGFDPDKGYKFSTYAVPMITGEIRSQMRDHSSACGSIKVSRNIKTDMANIRRAENEFVMKQGHSPRVSELCEMTGMSQERVQEAMQAADTVRNIEDYHSPEIMSKIDMMTNEEENNIIKLDIAHTLTKLEPLARKIMILRYYRDKTQNQVAQAMGLSQVQVCRIEKKTLRNMAELLGGEESC